MSCCLTCFMSSSSTILCLLIQISVVISSLTSTSYADPFFDQSSGAILSGAKAFVGSGNKFDGNGFNGDLGNNKLGDFVDSLNDLNGFYNDLHVLPTHPWQSLANPNPSPALNSRSNHNNNLLFGSQIPSRNFQRYGFGSSNYLPLWKSVKIGLKRSVDDMKITPPPGFVGARGRRDQDPGFIGVRGRRDQDPGFIGVRGRRGQDPGFIGVRGRRGQDPGFIGVRGRRGQESQSLESELNYKSNFRKRQEETMKNLNLMFPKLFSRLNEPQDEIQIGSMSEMMTARQAKSDTGSYKDGFIGVRG